MKDLIREFEAKHKSFAVAYGGDGTLLDVIRKSNFKKSFFPIRDYGLCEEHKNVLEELAGRVEGTLEFKQSIHPLLRFDVGSVVDCAAAEIVVKNKDMTSCMRFDLYVNGKKYMENVISDGIIFATSLGSHGYFKSVTRTIFSGSNVGIGFLCPTYGINNLVLDIRDKITMKFVRDTDVVVSADKLIYNDIHVSSGDEFSVSQEASRNLTLFGYDIFCCPKCRKNRNSTTINDQYLG